MTREKALRIHRVGEIRTGGTRELIEAYRDDDRRQEANSTVRRVFETATPTQLHVIRCQAGEIRRLRFRADELAEQNEFLTVRLAVATRLLAEAESLLGKRVTPPIGYVDRLSPQSEAAQ